MLSMDTLRLNKPNQAAMVTSWFTRANYSNHIPLQIIHVIASFFSLWRCHRLKDEIQDIIDVSTDPDGKKKFELILARTVVNTERIQFAIRV